MSRSQLPQNYIIRQGTVFEDFENISQWTKFGSGGTISADTTYKMYGSQSLRLNVTTAGSFVIARKTYASSQDMRETSRVIHMWFYPVTTPSTTISEMQITIYETVATKFFSWTPSGSTFLPDQWNHIVLHRNVWANTGSASWGNINAIEVRLTAASGQTASVCVDMWIHSQEQTPRCLIMFDDACDDVYTEAFAYMNPRGLKGTIFVVPSLVGTSGYCTLAQLEEMYEAGWSIANHTYSHQNLSTLSYNQIVDQIGRCTDWLISHGFTRGAYHLAYPYGGYNDNVFAAMDALGIKTGRSVLSLRLQNAPVDNYKILMSRALDNASSLSTIKSLFIDRAISWGQTAFLHGHKLEAAAGTNTWAISDFQALIDYIIARRLPCVTIDEWYEGLSNPRYLAVL